MTPLFKGVSLETAYIKKMTKRGLEPIGLRREAGGRNYRSEFDELEIY